MSAKILAHNQANNLADNEYIDKRTITPVSEDISKEVGNESQPRLSTALLTS